MASSLKANVSCKLEESPRLYKCTFCTKTFNVHGNLIKHTRTHTGERPFRCYICDKAFANPSNLTRHKRLHTGDRPYVCTFCQKTFRASSNLKEHLKSHLGDSTFTCQHCESSFTVFTEYSLHMEEHFETASRLLFGSSTTALSSTVSPDTLEKKEKINNSSEKSSSLTYICPGSVQEENMSNIKNNHTKRNLQEGNCNMQLDLVIPEDSSLLDTHKDSVFGVKANQSSRSCSERSLLSSSTYQDTELKTNAGLQYSGGSDLIPKVPMSKVGMEMVNYLQDNFNAYKAGSCIDIADLNKETAIQQLPTLSEIEFQTDGSSKSNLLTSRGDKEKQWNFGSPEEDQSGLEDSKKELANSGYCLDFRDETTYTLDELSNKLTQCFYCQRIFSTDVETKDGGDGDSSKEHPYCGTCNKNQTGNSWLTNSNNAKKSFKCLFCQNEFTDSVELNQHSCIMDVSDKRYNQYFKNSKSADCFDKDSLKTSTSFIDSCFEKVLLENQMDNNVQSSKDIQLDNVLGMKTVQIDSIHNNSKNIQLKVDAQGCKDGQLDNNDGSRDIQLDNFSDIRHNVLSESNKLSEASIKDISTARNSYSLSEKHKRLQESLTSTAIEYLKETVNSSPPSLPPPQSVDSDKDSDDVIIVNDMLQTLSNNGNITQNDVATGSVIFDREQNLSYSNTLTHKSSNNVNSHAERLDGENNPSDFTSIQISDKKSKESNKRSKSSTSGLVDNESTKNDKKLKTGPKIHKCRYCDKVFTVHGNLVKHIRIHTGEKPFQCALCTAAFANPSNLTRHVRIHTGEKPYKCTYCDRSFRDSSSLMSHHQTHLKYPLKNFSRNKKVSKNTSTKANPSQKLNHTDDKELENPIPSTKMDSGSNDAELFWSPELSSLHLKKNNNQNSKSKKRPLQTVGLDSFIDPDNKQMEVDISSSDLSKQSKSNKILHEMRKSKSKSNSSSSGSSSCTATTTVTTTTVCNDDSRNVSECQRPGVFGSGLSNYSPILIECKSEDAEDSKNGEKLVQESHFNDSTKIINSSCLDVVNKNKCLGNQNNNNNVDTTSADLNGNKSGKTKGRRLHACIYCSKSFTVHSNLIKHIRIHTGEKPFKCQLCDKAFANPSNMTRHLRVHTIEPCYKCTVCPRTFRAPNNLKVHMSLHTQSTTVQKVCFICQAVYARKRELVNHLKVHTSMEGTDYPNDYNSDSNECFTMPSPSPTTSNPNNIQFPFINQGFMQKAQPVCSSLQPDDTIEASKLDMNSSSLHFNSVNLKNTSNNKLASKLSGLPVKLRDSDSLEGNSLGKNILSETFTQSNEFCELPENLDSSEAGNEYFLSESHRPSLTVLDSNDDSKASYSDVCMENDDTVESKVHSESPDKKPKPEQVILIEENFSKDNFINLPYRDSHIEVENDNKNSISSYKREEISASIQSLSSDNDLLSIPSFEMKPMKYKAMKRKTHRKQHSCKFCGRGFPSRCNLIKHIRTHTGEKPFRCKCCRASFANPSNLTRHVRTHTGEKPYPCPHCTKSFRASSTLKHHIYTHAKCNTYKCRFCSKVYSIFSKFKLHLLTHSKSTAKQKYMVEVHSQNFLPPLSKPNSKSRLLSNKNTPDPKMSHSMDSYMLDEELQPSESNFVKNEEIVELENSKEISSLSEEAEAKSTPSLTHSELSENHLDRYSLFLENTLSTHANRWKTGAKKPKSRVKTHSIGLNEGSYWSQEPVEVPSPRKRKAIHKCNYCDKAFTVSSNLRKHVRTHTGEKPFMCRFCSRPFANPSNLIRHERIHTGEKPYICNFCPQHFAASSSLKEHIKRHTAISGNNDSLLLSDINLPSSYSMKQNSESLVKDKDITDDSTIKLNPNIKHENNYSESELETLNNCLNITKNSLELTEFSTTKVLEKKKNFLSKSLTDANDKTLVLENIKQEQHNHDEDLTTDNIEDGGVSSASVSSQQRLKHSKNGKTLEKKQGNSFRTCDEDSAKLSPVNPDSDVSTPDCIITSQEVYSNATSGGRGDENLADSFHNSSSNNNNNNNSSNSSSNNNSNNNHHHRNVHFRKSSSHKSSCLKELYMCKFGCGTFRSYKELRVHLQSHNEDEDDNDDDDEDDDDDEREDSQVDYDRDQLDCIDSLQENIEGHDTENKVLKLFLCEYGCDTYFSLEELQQHSLKVHKKLATINNQEHQQDSEPAGSRNNSVSEYESTFKCPYCTKLFSKQSQLTRHVRIHTGETRHNCHYCGAGFTNPSNLTRHIRTHTGEKPYSCPACKKAFSSSSNMKEHMKTHSRLSLYNCKFCSQKFSLFQRFQQHMKCHSNVNEITEDNEDNKATTAATTTTTPTTAINNSNDSNDNNNNGGDDDDNGDDDDDDEDNEDEVVEDNDDVEVDNKHCTSQSVIYVEELDHVNKRLVDEESAMIASNILSQEQQKESVGGNYQVPTAENMDHQLKGFPYFRDTEQRDNFTDVPLYTHIKPHSSQHRKNSVKSKDHIINLVDFSLSDYTTVNSKRPSAPSNAATKKQTNMARAQRSPSYVCKYCQKLFSVRSNLIKHIRTHTGERPFKCQLCETAFANPSNLTRHIRTHTGEKPYLCLHCSKTFRASSNLKVHLRAHCN